MKHEIQIDEGLTYIHLSGDIDLSCSEQVRQILIDLVAGHSHTIVELSLVTVIDSSGIASLLDAEKTAKRRGHKLELASPSASVSRVLELAQLNQYFTIRDYER